MIAPNPSDRPDVQPGRQVMIDAHENAPERVVGTAVFDRLAGTLMRSGGLERLLD